jgi:hypothetical protein
MNPTTGHNGSAGPSTAVDGYLWQVAGKPVSVHLNPAVSRLGREGTEAIRSLSMIGSEIGGLLLGTVVAGDPTLVVVEDYELIPCDYNRGPLYRLDKTGLERFDQAIFRHSSSGSGQEVVGFFRSHTRHGLALDADDIALCETRFGKPHQIALLIRPSLSQASRAGIFIWEQGVMRGEATALEFSFSDKSALRSGALAHTRAESSQLREDL